MGLGAYAQGEIYGAKEIEATPTRRWAISDP